MSTYSRLLDAYQRQERAVRDRVRAYITRAWPTGSWRDADMERFVATILPVVQSGQLQVAKLTEAHLRQVDQLVFNIRRPTAIPLTLRDVTGLRQGVDDDTLYRRPAVTIYTALSTGKPLEQAVRLGLQRALTLATTDLQLAKTQAARLRFDRDDTVSSYRRVLTGAESCALCSIASEHIYSRGDLMPIHGNCDCGVSAVRGRNDPAAAVNATRVVTGSAEVNARFGEEADIELDDRTDARKEQSAVATRTHGELGPVLAIAGQHFTSEDDLAA